MGCYRAVPGGIVLAVRLTPRSAQDAIDGTALLADSRAVVHIRVRAVPDKGAANFALLSFLSGLFSVPKSSVELVAGATARLKQVRISGSQPTLAAIAESWPAKKGSVTSG
jgi:uncharacterized protein (TIGR00251 family)